MGSGCVKPSTSATEPSERILKTETMTEPNERFSTENGTSSQDRSDMFAKLSEESFMTRISSPVKTDSSKITVVGTGQVGMACAFSLITEQLVNEVALIDLAKDKLKGELLDLQHGSTFVPRVRVVGDSDYAVSEGSKICIITAGVRQAPDQTRVQLLNQNVKLLQSIIPQLLKYSPEAILILVTNPVDVLTYAAWKISGRPVHTVIGSGTNLDTARLKYLISQRIGVNTRAIQVWIIGEHGDASVPVWSNLQIAGVNFQDIGDPSKMMEQEKLNELHTLVINSAYEIIKLKGYTSWAIGLSVADICKSILGNTRSIHALSTLVQGFHGVKDEVFLSLPCVIGATGITHIVPLVLNDKEKEMFLSAALKMYQVQQSTELEKE